MNAFLRWETLVTLMVTAILFLFVPEISLPFMEWQPWYWLVLGGLLQGVLVSSILTDPEAREQAKSEEFEREHDLRNIHNRDSRERMQSAFEYRRNMHKLADSARGAMRTQQRHLIGDIDDWIDQMYSLAQRIDLFESNDLAVRDMQQVPRKIARVRRRMEKEKDAGTLRDLKQQLEWLQRQYVSLEASFSNLKRAEIQLESTLSALGTVYAQMSLLGTKGTNTIRWQQLSVEIKEEIDKLHDTSEAMDEVQLLGEKLTGEFDFDYIAALEEADAEESAQRQRLGAPASGEADSSDIDLDIDAADSRAQSVQG